MNRTILVADDEVDVLTLLDLELSQEGYTVFKASSGDDAVKKVKNYMPDLIIMDILMPDLNGGQVVKLLKADVRTKHIPVIFLTAVLTGEETAAEQMGVAIDHVFYPAVAKPFNVKDLLSEIKRLLPKTERGIA